MTMMSSDPAPHEETPECAPCRSTRRSFLRRALLATAVAVPSLQVLFSPDAFAAKHKGHCLEAYCHIVDSWCSCGRYAIQYNCYCSICGGYCSTYYEDGGKC